MLAATGSREIEAHYELSTERIRSSIWSVSTDRTYGRWTEPGDSASFDSANPTPSDPWPLTLQHLVASLPARVRLAAGRPVAIVGEETWADTARRAIYGSSLPAAAIPSGEALVDAEGLLSDLARTFPGTPVEGRWERTERIAGVAASLVEECRKETTERGDLRWTCAGGAEEVDGESAELFEVQTWTEMEIDRMGLRLVETGYSGTLVTLSAAGDAAEDRPITGFRRVIRR